jgi:O-antigen/teichoic acid export membrane protein
MTEAEARSPAAPGDEAKRYGKTAGLLSIGVGATGLITYVFFALASHNLDKQDYGELVVLWSAVFITVGVLYRPVEQLLSRTLAEHETRGEPIAGPLRIAATIQAGLAVVFAVLALVFKGPLTDDLLSGNETLYWVLVAAVFSYAASYFARGFFAGTRRFPMYAALMLFESIIRTGFALVVAVGIASGQSVVALGIAVAPFVSLTLIPFAVRRGAGRREPAPRKTSGDSASPEFTLAHGSGFAAAVLMIMLAEQTFLNAGPLLVNASVGAAAAGFIFNVLMIARAPLQLFQAVATSLLPHLTRLRTDEAASGEEAFRLSVRSTLWAIACRGGRARAHAACLRREVHLRPRGPSHRHRGDGPLSLRCHPEPGRARAGPGAPGRRLLDRLRHRLRRMEPRPPRRGRVPPCRDRLHRSRGAALRASLRALPPPARPA